MPFIITAPETKTISQQYLLGTEVQVVNAVRTVDRVNIEHVKINMPINNPTGVSISVTWSIGYMDGAVFFPTERGSAELAGESLLAKMSEAVTPADSHYADFKGALYAVLVSLGHVPAGTVV
jgi:hypothetical protein